jgi:hypothetical protein
MNDEEYNLMKLYEFQWGSENHCSKRVERRFRYMTMIIEGKKIEANINTYETMLNYLFKEQKESFQDRILWISSMLYNTFLDLDLIKEWKSVECIYSQRAQALNIIKIIEQEIEVVDEDIDYQYHEDVNDSVSDKCNLTIDCNFGIAPLQKVWLSTIANVCIWFNDSYVCMWKDDYMKYIIEGCAKDDD